MKELVRDAAARADASIEPVLKQIARELLLLESSDWQFNITTWSARDYAERRLEEHYDAFQKLYRIAGDCLRTGTFSKEGADTLRVLEERDNPFEIVKPEWWL